MDPFDPPAIEAALLRAMQSLAPDMAPAKQRDFAFHMTDWLDDLAQLNAFYAHPEAYTPEAAAKLLIGFLAHVPEHISEAAFILTGSPVEHIFRRSRKWTAEE